ncbi:conserved protein, unknown function [Hepatocystis sp. ex Piliocolobus tephrosceles]|nr:conserved protein, unknown function [Hepatocystis sp. ex Piliocolobus tephrosceles]
MSTIKINKNEGSRVHVWIKSAIGTPNRRQYKHKHIMYPYFPMYKSPYRARDSRTRKAYWPCVDKYPWHTHQKRWVDYENLNIKFFSEFTNKSPDKKNLFETCHTLPYNGINCLFWNPIYKNSYKFLSKKCKSEEKEEQDETEGESVVDQTMEDEKSQTVANNSNQIVANNSNQTEWNNHKAIKINNYYYIVESKVKNNIYFYLKFIKYSMRPFRGKMIGDIYLNGKKIRSNVSTKGIVYGEWKYSFPHIHIKHELNNAILTSHNTTLNDNTDKELKTFDDDNNNIINDLVVVDKYTYRPPLPKCFNET